MHRSPTPGLLFLVLAVPCYFLPAAEPEARYGITPDLKAYPQSKPKEALSSILKAIDNKKFDYLLAHLAEPQWVDARLKRFGGKLELMAEEAKDQLSPLAVKRLKRFVKDGMWKTNGTTTVVSHPKIKGRVVKLKQINDRWYLQNDYQP